MKTFTLLSLLVLSTGCIKKQNQATIITGGGAPTVPYGYNPNTPITSDPVIPAPVDIENYPPYTPRRSQYLQGAYRGNAKLQTFINTMARKYNYDKYELNAIFSTVNRDTEALTKIGAFASSKPTQSKAVIPESWDQYRAKFLTNSRINKGVNFWRENQYYLNEASQRYGVAPEYILGIIGVETNFGGFTGKHSVLNALTSIALEFPKRSKFFTSELENYLLLIREQHIDPQYIKGSYAGAFGLAQFMPSSFREYAVDLDGNGQTNLFSPADAIGSVANYFKEKGKWNNHIPVAMPVYYNKARFYGLATGFKTSYTQKHLYALGMRPSSNFYGYKGQVSLIKLHRYSRDELWWATPNFYSIARYNPKDFYAMAVHQLAQAIRLAYYKR